MNINYINKLNIFLNENGLELIGYAEMYFDTNKTFLIDIEVKNKFFTKNSEFLDNIVVFLEENREIPFKNVFVKEFTISNRIKIGYI